MLTIDHLKKYSVSILKKEISKQNIKGYSKMKRGDLVALMLQHQDKFMYLREESHIMPDGSKMSGAIHSKDSVDFVTEYKKKFPDVKKKAEPPKKTKADLLKLGEKYKELLINISYAGTNMTKYKNRYEEFIDRVKKDEIPNKFNTFDSAFKTFTRSFDKLIRKDKEEKAERTKKKEERKKKAEEELKKKKEEPPKKKAEPSKDLESKLSDISEPFYDKYIKEIKNPPKNTLETPVKKYNKLMKDLKADYQKAVEAKMGKKNLSKNVNDFWNADIIPEFKDANYDMLQKSTYMDAEFIKIDPKTAQFIKKYKSK